MKARVDHLRYVGVAAPNFEEAVNFYDGVWGLKRVDGDKDIAFFAAEASPEQYVYRIRRSPEKRFDLVAFGAEDDEAVDALAQDLQAAGVKLASEPAKLQTPGGGYGFRLFDPDGRVVEVSSGVAPRQVREVDEREGIPVGLNHIVFASTERKRSEAFYQDLLGFKLSDWIPFMGFLRCNTNHHSIAFSDGRATMLNHVAFEVPNIDSMMRGAGRVMQDGRARVMMGPGRHSAGDNTFYYFFDPEGNVSEYTAEVQQILDDDAWTPREHPPTDMWGTAQMPGRPAGAAGSGPAPSGGRPSGDDVAPIRTVENDPGLWLAPPI